MRKSLLLLVALLVGICSAEAQKQFSLLINAPFCIYAEPHAKEITPPAPVPMCMLPKGTPVTVLGHSWQKDFVQVTLNDGSLGYIPTLAIALPEAHIYNKYGGSNWAQGTYRLQSISGWEGLRPRKLIFRHENGKSYTFAKSEDYFPNLRYKEALERITYGDFFERNGIAYYMEDRDDKVLRLGLKEGQLPLSLIGCSKSYIDELLSPAFGYAGPSVSEFNGYVYAFYENLIWPMPEVKKNFWGAGVIIYFNHDLVAVYMEKMPWTFDFKPDYSTLRASTTPSEGYSPEIASALAKARIKQFRYRKAAPLVEQYAAPKGGQAIKHKALYLFENHLGITNRWAIIGILLVVLLVVQVVAYYLVRWFYKGSNERIGLIGFLIVLPFTLYALIYIARFHILVAIIAFFVLLGVSFYASIFLSVGAETDRCEKCHKWLEPFNYILLSSVGVMHQKPKRGLSAEMIHSEARSPIVSTDINIKLGLGHLMSRASARGTYGGVSHSAEARAWNFKTTVKVTWPYRVKLRCPYCGHTWEVRLSQQTEEPGPVLYSVYGDRQAQWNERERIEWRRGPNGELVHSEEHDRARSSSSSFSGPKRYDTERYNRYLRRFLNGDHGALSAYEREAFGNYWGD